MDAIARGKKLKNVSVKVGPSQDSPPSTAFPKVVPRASAVPLSGGLGDIAGMLKGMLQI